MINSEKILSYLTLNKEQFKAKYHLIRIGIFGSYARNEQSDKSDIDIIVEFEDNTSNLYELKQNLKQEIQLKFNVPVDICREKYIKSIFKSQILSEALYA